MTIELSLSGRHQDGRADFSDVEFADVGGAPFRVLGRALRRLREYLIADKGMETADDVLPSHDVDVLNELAERADEPPPAPAAPSPGFSEPEPTTPQPHEDDMTDTRTAADQTTAAEKARQAELERREKEIAAKEAAFAEQAARNEAEAFVKPLVEQGKVLPGESDALIAFMAKVDAEETVEFADGASKPATAVFKDFLTGLPQRVDFSERTGKVPGETTDKQNATAIANAAHKLVKARADEGLSISFSDAVIEVTKDS